MPTSTIPHADGLELYDEDHGAGRPVVLVHGWPLSGRSWEAQAPALVNGGHRVVTYDRRGFGRSSQADSGYDDDTMARDLQELMVCLDLSEATLVGFSMGGGEVARCIGAHGTTRLAGAVFAAAVPPSLHQTEGNPDGGLDDATIEQLQRGILSDRPAFLERFVDSFYAAGERHDLVSDAQQVSGKRTHEAIEGCGLALIEGGRHGLNLSHAGEFNAALLRFLAA